MTNSENASDKTTHTPGTRKGEEIGKDEAQEPKHKPSDSTGINPQDEQPIDQKMPKMPAP